MGSQHDVQLAPGVVLAVVTATITISALLAGAFGIIPKNLHSHKEQERFEWKETFDIGLDLCMLTWIFIYIHYQYFSKLAIGLLWYQT